MPSEEPQHLRQRKLAAIARQGAERMAAAYKLMRLRCASLSVEADGYVA